MKKAIILTAAAIAMISCAKITPETPVKDAEKTINTPVSFEAYNYAGQTKAASNELRFYLGGTFNVYSFYSATNWEGLADELPADSKFIQGDGVAWRAASGEFTSAVWRTENTYYWPKTGTLSFYAYYPSAVSDFVTVAKKSEGVKFTDYSVLETVAAQNAATQIKNGNVVDANGRYPGTEGYDSTNGTIDDLNDILVADLVTDKTANDNGTYYTKGVPMLFRHKLAKVKLQAKQAKKPDQGVVNGTFRIIIDAISIDNIHLKGSYSSASSATVWTTGDNLIAASSTDTHKNSGNFVADMTNDGKGENDAFDDTHALPLFYSKGTTENDYLNLGKEYYVLPQNIDDLSNLLVSYTVFALDNDNKILSSTKYENVKVQLNTITLANSNKINSWEINKFYTYKLLFSPYGEPIIFDPAVADWDKVTADPSTVYSK